ncbi:hypothetical protein ACFWPV_13635 [Streptomyces uncialis]|uniref:hypothetical protein n=1 Tax=Streptomyces uncialis TaxID=1048205 RepID=UPI0036632AFE
MYEVRDHPEGGYYIVHELSGHLAHVQRDGHLVAAIFADWDEADQHRRDLISYAVETRGRYS